MFCCYLYWYEKVWQGSSDFIPEEIGSGRTSLHLKFVCCDRTMTEPRLDQFQLGYRKYTSHMLLGFGSVILWFKDFPLVGRFFFTWDLNKTLTQTLQKSHTYAIKKNWRRIFTLQIYTDKFPQIVCPEIIWIVSFIHFQKENFSFISVPACKSNACLM